MKPVFVLLRHLPTEEDAVGVLTPQKALTKAQPVIESEVQGIGRALNDLSNALDWPIRIASSVTDRGERTAEAILPLIERPTTVSLDDRLLNINQGMVAGELQSTFEKMPLYYRWHKLPHLTSFPEGESLADVRKRVDELLSEMSTSVAVNVLISHTTTLQVALTSLLGTDVRWVWNYYFAYYQLTVVAGTTLVCANSRASTGPWLRELRG